MYQAPPAKSKSKSTATLTHTNDTSSKHLRKKCALISVSNKNGVEAFATQLEQLGYEIISTGGTYSALKTAGINVREVQSVTDFPEIMDGRVKTLHPRIHGGILARTNEDPMLLSQYQIPLIDLVVVNLYPFQATIAKSDCSFEDAIENIDIGGPCMIRAAAKNQARVTVVVDNNDYQKVIKALNKESEIPETLRSELAAKAFAHTSAYDAAICAYLSKPTNQNSGKEDDFPKHLVLPFEKIQTARYGENPHQSAAIYQRLDEKTPANLADATLIQGKALSYNNIADADAALATVKAFDAPACIIVKHANPCGAAVRDNLLEAYRAAFQTDPTSAFGGIIAVNRPLDANTATAILESQFVEVIVAPNVEPDAMEILATKPNCRVLSVGEWSRGDKTAATYRTELKSISGGLLVQSVDQKLIDAADLKVVTHIKPTAAQIADLIFAFRLAKYVKSNAIVYAKNQQSIGIGAGQMSRVYSAKIAGIKASDEGLQVSGCVMASDAFFPFRDGIDSAAKVGIGAVIQPGGSKRDQEVIDAANEHGMAMVFTQVRHFKH